MPFVTFNLEEIKQEQIINSNELMTIVPAVITETKQPTRILLLKYNGNLEKFVFTMYPSEKSNESLFSGKVKITDLKGNLKIGYIYKDGYLTHYFLKDKNLKKEKNLNLGYNNKGVAENDMPPEGLLETVTVTGHYPYSNMIYLLLLLEQGIPDNNGTGTSGNSESNGEHWDFTHGGGNTTPKPKVDEEEIKDPKVKCIYEKLKSLNGSFKNSLKKFDGEFPVAHLKIITSDDMPDSINATTSPPENYTIKIQINTNNLNRPNLSIVRTIVHEAIHAEMFRKLLSLSNKNGSIDVYKLKNMLNNKNYPGIFDYYTRYGVNGFQHEQMAQHYRDFMIDILKQFDSSQSDDVYQALSWVGLLGTNAWNSLNDNYKKKMKQINKEFSKKGGESCE